MVIQSRSWGQEPERHNSPRSQGWALLWNSSCLLGLVMWVGENKSGLKELREASWRPRAGTCR